MESQNALKPLHQARAQGLAPDTPTNSQQGCDSPSGDPEISSRASQDSAKLDTCHQPPGLHSCRADLSGAAVLITAELTGSNEGDLPNRSLAQNSNEGRGALNSQIAGKGNYNRYYGYRLAKGETEDPRLQVSLTLTRFSMRFKR